MRWRLILFTKLIILFVCMLFCSVLVGCDALTNCKHRNLLFRIRSIAPPVAMLATLRCSTVGWVTNYSHHPWLRSIATVTNHYKARSDDSVSSLLLQKITAIMWPGDPNLSSKTATLVQNHQEDHQEVWPCGEIHFKCPAFAVEEMLNISL